MWNDGKLGIPLRRRRFAGAKRRSRVLQIALNPGCGWVRNAEHTPPDPIRVLERRHGLADIIERGAGVIAERRRVTPLHYEREDIIISESAPRHGDRFAQQRLDFLIALQLNKGLRVTAGFSEGFCMLPLLDKYPLVRWEITGIAEKRLRESTLLQVVPKEQTRLPSSACLSQSFSYHADLLEDDGDGLRTPPGARGGAGQLI